MYFHLRLIAHSSVTDRRATKLILHVTTKLNRHDPRPTFPIVLAYKCSEPLLQHFEDRLSLSRADVTRCFDATKLYLLFMCSEEAGGRAYCAPEAIDQMLVVFLARKADFPEFWRGVLHQFEHFERNVYSEETPKGLDPFSTLQSAKRFFNSDTLGEDWYVAPPLREVQARLGCDVCPNRDGCPVFNFNA